MREAASFISGQFLSRETGLFHSIGQAARRAYLGWISRRQVVALSEFDDHLLADIGLTRHDVDEALELPFSHDPGRELQFRASRNRRRGWNA